MTLKIETEGLLNNGIYLKEVQSSLEQKHIFVRLPKVTVKADIEDSVREIVIKMSPYNQEKLSKLDLSPVFQGFIQQQAQPNRDSSQMIYKLLNIDSDYFYKFSNLKQLFQFQKNYDSEIPLDKYNSTPVLSHKIIVARSGNGKSFLLLYLISFLALSQKHILLVADYKQSDVFIACRDNLGLRSVSSKEDILQMVEDTYLELLNRQKTFNDYQENKLGLTMDKLGYKPLFLVIDELASFTAALDKKELEQFNFHFKQIMLLGRALSVFCLITMQQFNVKNLGGSSEIKEQFSDQILLGNNDSQTVQNLYGTNELPNFQMEKGNGFLQNDSNLKPILFRSPFLEPSFFKHLEQLNLKLQTKK
ncbi:hypothetical protein CUM91_09555 [Enterococcus faecalis]|uniref:hypothetical protein n=1 Tax=Enterococcus faecalis TaxID=1351 RepID=UPI000CF5F2DD|nr:hypothetical protein [Enterococcus faecalis]PQC13429.1 hypothetical protein CUM91_09555 [Enterococcus faecalis]